MKSSVNLLSLLITFIHQAHQGRVSQILNEQLAMMRNRK